MPTPRVAMRKIKECLRLKLDCDLSHERIALALGLSKGVVSKYVARAEAAGLDWPALSALEETQVAARLCAPAPVVRGDRAPIDLAWVHRELRRKGVTRHLLWQEYREANADQTTYQYTQFWALSRSLWKRAAVSRGVGEGALARRVPLPGLRSYEPLSSQAPQRVPVQPLQAASVADQRHTVGRDQVAAANVVDRLRR